MKKNFTILLFSMLTCTFICAQEADIWDYTFEPWTKGSGSESDPYLIEKASHLAYLAKEVNEGKTFLRTYFRLENNLDLSGNENADFRLDWTPIGSDRTTIYFNGIFDGNGKTISNLYSGYEVSRAFPGVFGTAGNESIIKNLGITGDSRVKFNGGSAGSVAGYSEGSIINCYNTGCIIDIENNNAGYGNAGGIVGSGKIIENCYNTCDVKINGSCMQSTANVYVGGIAGYAENIKVVTIPEMFLPRSGALLWEEEMAGPAELPDGVKKKS